MRLGLCASIRRRHLLTRGVHGERHSCYVFVKLIVVIHPIGARFRLLDVGRRRRGMPRRKRAGD